MCQEVDEKKTSSSEYTTDDEWEEQQRKTRAEWEKERGNQFFKDNLLNEAINCYTKAIELDPLNAVYPANRAMCLLKQEKYGVAEADCSLSIELDADYTKAYYRRANARFKLNKLDEAKKDYEQVLKLDPSNKAAQSELIKLEQLIEGSHLIFPVQKSEQERSKKPLKRILIEETNSDSVNKLETEKKLNELRERTKLDSRDEKLFENSKIVNQKEDSKKIVEIDTSLIDNLSLNHDVERVKDIIQKDIKPDPKQNVNTNQEIKKLVIPDRPQNGYQFKKDWQYLSKNMTGLASYFKV